MYWFRYRSNTFQYGGSATGINLVNIPAGLNAVTDAVAKTITISGIPQEQDL